MIQEGKIIVIHTANEPPYSVPEVATWGNVKLLEPLREETLHSIITKLWYEFGLERGEPVITDFGKYLIEKRGDLFANAESLVHVFNPAV